MKKSALIAAPLALAASLAFAQTASAAPADTPTPALGCAQVLNLDKPPLGTNIDAINRVAAALGACPEFRTASGPCAKRPSRPTPSTA
ncbi:hypothetical protein [Streptomyces sp. NPDC054765]